MHGTKARPTALRSIVVGAAIGSLALVPNVLRGQQPVIVGELVRLQPTNDPSITYGRNSGGDIILATKLLDGSQSITECSPNGQLKYILRTIPPIEPGKTDYLAMLNLNETIVIEGPPLQTQQAQATNNPSQFALLAPWAAIYFGGLATVVAIGMATEALLRKMGLTSNRGSAPRSSYSGTGFARIAEARERERGEKTENDKHHAERRAEKDAYERRYRDENGIH